MIGGFLVLEGNQHMKQWQNHREFKTLQSLNNSDFRIRKDEEQISSKIQTKPKFQKKIKHKSNIKDLSKYVLTSWVVIFVCSKKTSWVVIRNVEQLKLEDDVM